MKKIYYKLNHRATHPSIAYRMVNELKEGKVIYVKLLDVQAKKILDNLYSTIENWLSDENIGIEMDYKYKFNSKSIKYFIIKVKTKEER